MDNAARIADAYLAWWHGAGVDSAVADAPVDWLRPESSVAATARRPAGGPPKATTPRDLESFRQWLEQDAAQPERRWATRIILPAGPADAPLMVVTDMPDPADGEANILLADRAGALFDAMLRAIGLDRAQCHVASLFCARPPGGMVEAADIATAATRMRLHVALARPRRLLLLGDRTIRALMPDAPAAPNGLRDFNHQGGIVPAVATFHPRLLLGQPAAKAECWRALQSLIEEPRP
jgi:DNA polymerase